MHTHQIIRVGPPQSICFDSFFPYFVSKQCSSKCDILALSSTITIDCSKPSPPPPPPTILISCHSCNCWDISRVTPIPPPLVLYYFCFSENKAWRILCSPEWPLTMADTTVSPSWSTCRSAAGAPGTFWWRSPISSTQEANGSAHGSGTMSMDLILHRDISWRTLVSFIDF